MSTIQVFDTQRQLPSGRGYEASVNDGSPELADERGFIFGSVKAGGSKGSSPRRE